VFTAELSAGETRSFKLSTLAMLAQILPALEQEAPIDPASLTRGMASQIGWVEGGLSAFTARQTDKDGKTVGDEQTHFSLGAQGGEGGYVLLAALEYFVSGFDAFAKLRRSHLQHFRIDRVKALVRVVAAQTVTKGWVAIPYVILEP
jgi:hypothetical protein